MESNGRESKNEMETINIIVAGSLNAQKRAFIHKVAERDIISGGHSHRPLPPESDYTVAEFGRITLNDDWVLYLFGCDLFLLSRFSQTDFLDNLREVDGFSLVIDSCDENSFYEAKGLIKYLEPLPYIVIANKQDREDAMSVGQIRRAMELPAETLILPCVATERASVAHVLNTLLAMIRPDLTERIKE